MPERSEPRAKGKYQEWLEPDKLILLEGWARDGLTDEQIAFNMGIGTTTLYRWKDEYREIRESLKKGKEVIDRQVENALLKKALGDTVVLKKPIKVKEVLYENGKRLKETERIEYVVEEVLIPPDTTAQIYWLKNRKPEEWRDKREVESRVEVETDGFIEALKGDVAATFEKAGGLIET